MFFFQVLLIYKQLFFFLVFFYKKQLQNLVSTKNSACYKDCKTAFFKNHREKFCFNTKWAKKKMKAVKLQSLLTGLSVHLDQFISERISAMQLSSAYVYRQLSDRYFKYNKAIHGSYELSTFQRWDLLKKVSSKVYQQFSYPCFIGMRYTLQYSRLSLWCMLKLAKNYSFLSLFTPFKTSLHPVFSKGKVSSIFLRNYHDSHLVFGWVFHFMHGIGKFYSLFNLFKKSLSRSTSVSMWHISQHMKSKYTVSLGEEFLDNLNSDFSYDDVSQDALFKTGLFFRCKLKFRSSAYINTCKVFLYNTNTFFSSFSQYLWQLTVKKSVLQKYNFRLMSSSCFIRNTSFFLTSFFKGLSLLDFYGVFKNQFATLKISSFIDLFHMSLFFIWQVSREESTSFSDKKRWLTKICKLFFVVSGTTYSNLLVLEGCVHLWLHYISTGVYCFTYTSFLVQFTNFFSRLFFFNCVQSKAGYSAFKFQKTTFISEFTLCVRRLKTMFVSTHAMGSFFYTVLLLKSDSGFFFF